MSTDAPVSENPYSPPLARIEATDAFSAGGTVVFAGFWRRAAALCIDSLVVGIVYYGIVFGGMLAAGVNLAALGQAQVGAGAITGVLAALYLVYPLVSGLYYVLQESSGAQATLGKRAVGIKVTDSDGQRLQRGHALGRWASHLLCYFTFYIGYLMAAFTDRKRGLHDMVARTLVVDRWAFTPSPERQKDRVGTVAIAVLVVAALLMVAYVGVLMAMVLPALQASAQGAAG